MQQLTACPICRSHQIRLSFSHEEGNGRLWRVDACAECQGGFENPQPSWGDLAEYYSETYSAYAESHGSQGLDEQVIADARETGQFRHTAIQGGDRLLDVGCGGGYFLRIASQLGAVVQGVEPNPFAAARARQCGVPVFAGTLEEYVEAYPSARFDTITANHVLEHMPDPVAALAVMRTLLKPDGGVTVAVPNARCWAARALRGRWHSTDLPRHLMQFSRRSLATAAERAGLGISEIVTYSLASATAGSLRLWLRFRCLLPRRLTSRLRMIDTRVAPAVAKWLDERAVGEALIGRFALDALAKCIGER